MLGCSVVERRIGNKAKDNKTDTKINKSTFRGSLIFKNNCPKPRNTKVIIMYIDKSCPRVWFVDLSFNQLSIII